MRIRGHMFKPKMSREDLDKQSRESDKHMARLTKAFVQVPEEKSIFWQLVKLFLKP